MACIVSSSKLVTCAQTPNLLGLELHLYEKSNGWFLKDKQVAENMVVELPLDESGNKIVRIGHSPDPDDAFMFHAMTTNAFPTPGYNFVHELQDIETLNHRAMNQDLEVSAVSIHAYPDIAEHYALMNCGASVGEGYGPMVVCKAGVTEEQRKKAQEAALRVTKAASAAMSQAMVMHQSADNNALVKAAQDTARTLSLQLGGGPVGPSNHAPLPSLHGHFHSEIEINDFPQQARWKVTSKEAVSDLERSYDVALTPKGVYVKKGSKPPPGERKLYIIIEGKSEMSVRRCRAEMKKRIEDEVRKLHLPSSVARAGGRYQV